MARFAVTRRRLLVLAVVVAIVGVVAPACQMISCNMHAEGMGMMDGGLSFMTHCGGDYSSQAIPAAVVTSGTELIVIALMAGLFAAFVRISPNSAIRPVLFVDAMPPPPPEDPRGERIRI